MHIQAQIPHLERWVFVIGVVLAQSMPEHKAKQHNKCTDLIMQT